MKIVVFVHCVGLVEWKNNKRQYRLVFFKSKAKKCALAGATQIVGPLFSVSANYTNNSSSPPIIKANSAVLFFLSQVKIDHQSGIIERRKEKQRKGS